LDHLGRMLFERIEYWLDQGMGSLKWTPLFGPRAAPL
jgi:hypothetical protein